MTEEDFAAAFRERDLTRLERGARSSDALLTWLAYGSSSVGWMEGLDLAFRLGVSPDASELSITALERAAMGPHTEIVAKLVSHGADPNIGVPLVNAARHGDLESVRLLLEHGADIHQCNSGFPDALEMADTYGQTEVAEFLRDRLGDAARPPATIEAPTLPTLDIVESERPSPADLEAASAQARETYEVLAYVRAEELQRMVPVVDREAVKAAFWDGPVAEPPGEGHVEHL